MGQRTSGPITLKSDQFFFQKTSKLLQPRIVELRWPHASLAAMLAFGAAAAIAYLWARNASLESALTKARNEVNTATATATAQAERIAAFEGARSQDAQSVAAGVADVERANRRALDLASKVEAVVPEQVAAGDVAVAVAPDGVRVRVELRDGFMFDGGAMKLTDLSVDAVRAIAGVVRKGEGSIEVTGHIDPRRSRTDAELSDGNWGLSSARATLVARALENARVSSKRIQVTSKGATHPLAGNGSSKGRAKNRRVEIWLTP